MVDGESDNKTNTPGINLKDVRCAVCAYDATELQLLTNIVIATRCFCNDE